MLVKSDADPGPGAGNLRTEEGGLRCRGESFAEITQ